MLPMFTPTSDRVLVKDMTPEISAGGITLSAASRIDLRRGKVIAVGPGKIYDNGVQREVAFKAGDEVVFVASSASEVTFLDRTKLYLMSETAVLGVVNANQS